MIRRDFVYVAYTLLLLTVCVAGAGRLYHQRQTVIVPWVASQSGQARIFFESNEWLYKPYEAPKLETLQYLFQPLLLFPDVSDGLSALAEDPQKTPPVNLNIDHNWEFTDTPANVRARMLHRADNFQPFYERGATVYYSVSRYKPLPGAKYPVLSHQYWYYFPVGAGETAGSQDQQFVVVEVVQKLSLKGLWGRALTDSDIEVDAVYITGPMSLSRPDTAIIRKYLPEELAFLRFRPLIDVDGSTHHFSPVSVPDLSSTAMKANDNSRRDTYNRQRLLVDNMMKNRRLVHSKGGEAMIPMSHQGDWNNPYRGGKNVHGLPPDGTFWKHPVYTEGSQKWYLQQKQ